MPRAVAKLETGHASRYLQQLCKHWGHKFDVSFDPTQGRIDMGDGRIVEMTADAVHLIVTVEAEGTDGLETLENVVADHLARFAFRESLAFDWKRHG